MSFLYFSRLVRIYQTFIFHNEAFLPRNVYFYQDLKNFSSFVTLVTLLRQFLISIENKWLLLPDEHPSLGKHMLYNTAGEQ